MIDYLMTLPIWAWPLGIYFVYCFLLGVYEGWYDLPPSPIGPWSKSAQPQRSGSGDGWVQEPLQRPDLRYWRRRTGCTIERREPTIRIEQ